MSTPNIYRLRRARPRDIDALVTLERHFPTDRLRRSHLRHLIMRGHVDVFVIEHGGTPVADAIVLYRANSSSARLYSVVVEPAHRGKNLGNILLDAAETAASKHRCEAMLLEVRPDNRAALKLYENRGYTRIGHIERFYEDGTTALRLQIQLTAKLSAAA